VAALAVTAVIAGKAGVRRLLASLVLWRIPVGWYLFVLLGLPAVYVLGILLVAPGALACAEALACELDNTAMRATALNVLGLSRWLSGDQEGSATALNQGLRISLEVGNPTLIANAPRQLGIVARWQAEYVRAAVLLHTRVALASKHDRGFGLARSSSNLGRVAYFQHEYRQAWTCLRQAFDVIREARLGGWPLADSLDWLAAVTFAQGDAIGAARLFGAAEAQWRASGAIRYAPDQPAYERDVASARSTVDEYAFEGAWAEGRLMNAHEAIAYALKEAPPELGQAATSTVGTASLGFRPADSTGAEPVETRVESLLTSNSTECRSRRVNRVGTVGAGSAETSEHGSTTGQPRMCAVPRSRGPGRTSCAGAKRLLTRRVLPSCRRKPSRVVSYDRSRLHRM
jgi:hypothetical protein